jgi:hypothetical protein
MRRTRKKSARITGIHGAFSKKGKLVRYERDPLDGSVVATSTVLTEEHNLQSEENHAVDHTLLNRPNSQQLDDEWETSINQLHDSQEASSLLPRLWKFGFIGFMVGSLCTAAFLMINDANKASFKMDKVREELHDHKDTVSTTDDDYAQRDLVNPATMDDDQDSLESADEIVQSWMANYTLACDSQNWDLFRASFTEDATIVYYETTGGAQHGGNVNDAIDFLTSKSPQEEQQKDLRQEMLGATLPTITHKHEHYTTIVEDTNGDDNNDTIWLIHNSNTSRHDTYTSTLVFHGTFMTPLWGLSSLYVQGMYTHELVQVMDDSGEGVHAWKSKMTQEDCHYHTLEFLRNSLILSVVYVLYSIIMKSKLFNNNKKMTPSGEMVKDDYEISCHVTSPLKEYNERKQSHNKEDTVQEREEAMSGNDMARTVEIVTPWTPTPFLEHTKKLVDPPRTSNPCSRSSRRPYETDKIKELRLRRLRSQQVLSNRLRQSVSLVTRSSSSPISITSTCVSSITSASFRTNREESSPTRKNNHTTHTAPHTPNRMEWKARRNLVVDPAKSTVDNHEQIQADTSGATTEISSLSLSSCSSLETPVLGFV